MAQATESQGGMFGAVTSPLKGTTWLPVGKYVLYALVIGIVVATTVIVIDYMFPFLPVSPVGPSAAARTGKTFWRNADRTGSDENLLVPASKSPTTQAANYSMSFQMIIGDSRNVNGRFRHVLHRGSNPCGLTGDVAGPTGHAGIQPSDIAPSAEESTYVENGFPAIMNPGLFLDKYKNDLHVFVHTRGREEGMEVLWLESATVEDLPLNQPITIGVVCTGRSLEVYVNCRLYSTVMLRGTPYLPAADNQWFGRYCLFPFSGLLKNLTLWSTALNSSDFIQMCRTPGSFNMTNLPSTCTAPTQTAATQ